MKKEYFSPKLIDLGNIVELTFSGKFGWGGDHYSTRNS